MPLCGLLNMGKDSIAVGGNKGYKGYKDNKDNKGNTGNTCDMGNTCLCYDGIYIL